MRIELHDEAERLAAQQAVDLLRELRRAGREQEGRGLAALEEVILDRGREHLRKTLELAAGAHPEAQKGGPAAGPATPAGDAPPSRSVRGARCRPPPARCGWSVATTAAWAAA